MVLAGTVSWQLPSLTPPLTFKNPQVSLTHSLSHSLSVSLTPSLSHSLTVSLTLFHTLQVFLEGRKDEYDSQCLLY